MLSQQSFVPDMGLSLLPSGKGFLKCKVRESITANNKYYSGLKLDREITNSVYSTFQYVNINVYIRISYWFSRCRNKCQFWSRMISACSISSLTLASFFFFLAAWVTFCPFLFNLSLKS